MSNLSNTKFISEAIKIYKDEIASRNNEDYEINYPQWEKLEFACNFFRKMVSDENSLEIMAEPREVCGGVTATFSLFYISGEDIDDLKEVIGDSSAISIDALVDGRVCISLTIPDVYRLKNIPFDP